MKRLLIALTILTLLLAVCWFGGGALPVSAAYAVTEEPGGGATLSLVIDRPGPFVDLIFPQGDARFAKPWPFAKQRRMWTWWRGPVTLPLAEGKGPLRLTGLPHPASGSEPQLILPDGWQQVGAYAGRFELRQSGALEIAVPAGMAGAPAAVERVNQLYAAAVAMLGDQPLSKTVVLVDGAPTSLAGSVVDLWMPAYADDAQWWATGAAGVYAEKLLDKTKLWTGQEKEKWTERKFKEKGFALVTWLDATLRLSTGSKQALDPVFRAALGARTNAEVLKAVRDAGGVAPADHLDRMLRGREPLPVTGL